MLRYIGRQLLNLVFTLLLVSFIIYIIFSVIPGDPVSLLTGVSASPEQIEVLREKLGLNQNLFVRYISWLKGALRADFGNSIQYSIPVKDLIWDRLVVTSSLAMLSIIIIVLLALPLGLLSAYYYKTIWDKIIANVVVLGLSIPNYFLGILIIWILGLVFKLFTPGIFVNYDDNVWQFLICLLFPALAIAIPNICIMVKFIRTAVLEQFKQDYVKTAKSKGGTKKHIMYKHIMKNAITPIITLFGMIIAEVLAGSIVIEQVFSLPGLGRLLIGAINSRDFPVVMTLVLYITFLVVIINSFVELLLRMNDPRIRNA